MLFAGPRLGHAASYQVDVPFGFMMLANHHAPANIQNFLNPPWPQLMDSQLIFPFDIYFTNPADQYFFDGAMWLDGSGNPGVYTIGTGAGAFYFNPGPAFQGTLVGAASAGVVQLSPSVPGWHMRGRQNIGRGTFESTFGRSPRDYTFVHAYRFLNNNYITYQFANSPNPANRRWTPSAPILNVGEAMWCSLGASTGPANPQYFTPQPVNFTITGVSPGTTNQNVNPVDILVTGTGLASGDQVRLERMGNGPQTPWVSGVADPDGYILTATMNLSPLTKGYYRVYVRKAGNNVQSLDNVFYLDIPSPKLVVTLSAPPQVLPNVPVPCTMCVMNPTANAINNVTMSMVVPGAGVTISPPISTSTGVAPTPVWQVGNPGTQTQNGPFNFQPNGTSCQTFNVTVPNALLNTTLQLVAQVTGPNPQVGQAVSLMEVVAAFDPNDKVGPIGVGPERYITGLDASGYTIRFENMSDATAPAHEVTVTDQLDTDRLNLATFELGTVTFGPKVVTPPAGLSNWSTDVPYDVDGNPNTLADNILVRIEATLDGVLTSPTYGRVQWKFSSRESTPPHQPVTLPLVGFLPPNVTTPEGQGSVSFRITPFALSSGDTITNQANIFFDTNDPILTGVWTNTVDLDLPTSRVTSLIATQATASFTVEWAGSDAHSGLDRFDVLVSDDYGPFVIWQQGVTNTSATFTGEPNHTYRFYSVASDKVGHVEQAPETHDAETTVAGGCPPATLGIVLVDDAIELTWEQPGYRLQATTDFKEWEEMPAATSPIRVPKGDGFRGFRLICR